MPTEELDKRIATLEQKIDAVYTSVEKTRKYFLMLLVASAAMVILPLFGLVFAIPSFMSTYSAMQELDPIDQLEMGGMDANYEAQLRSLLEDI